MPYLQSIEMFPNVGLKKDSNMESFHNSEPQTASPSILTECQAEYCAFCGAINRMLSRKCNNCGWWPAFPVGIVNHDKFRHRFHLKSIQIRFWPQLLKTWLHLNRKLMTATTGLILLSAGLAAQAATNDNAVFIGGTPIMRVRVADAGYSPDQRASAIQEWLNRIFAHSPIHPSDITTSAEGAEAVMRVKGRLLFTADMATAHYNQATPIELANQWADHMRAVLPELTQAN